MDRKSFAAMECPIARATDEIGDAWSLLILRSAFLGVRSFQGFEARLNVPPSTLTRKLRQLCERGLLQRLRYREHPPRAEYLLSEKGRDLLPVLLALAAWGNRWLAPEGAPLLIVDAQTREPVNPMVCDARTRRPLVVGQVAIAAGPGASQGLRAALPEPVLFGAEAS
jgi:DNA-binding HxlR family transcriptional regulator